MQVTIDSDAEIRTLRERVAELEAQLGSKGPASLAGADATTLVTAAENILLDRYLQEGFVFTLRGRLPWLVGMLLLQSLTAYIMSRFDGLLSRQLVIAFFLPVIVGTGGNSGNQPGVAVTRALGLGKVDSHTMSHIVRKELILAVVTATVLAIVAFIRVIAEYRNDPKAAATIGCSIFVIVIVSVILGVGFSFGLDKLRVDPANGSAPLLATVTDVIGVCVMCGIASSIFGGAR